MNTEVVKNSKVVHVTSVHSSLDVRIFYKQCRSLAAAGYDVSLVEVGNTGFEEIDGVHIFRVKPRKGRFARIFISSFEVVRKALRLKADVIQFHDPELLPYAVVLALFGKNIIFDFHEDYAKKMIERSWLPVLLRRGAVFIFSLLSAVGGKFFRAKLAATPSIAAQHIGKKIKVIANYPLVEISERSQVAFENYGTSPSNTQLIYTGGWTANRGVCQIVNALPLVTYPGVRLTVIGQTEPAERAHVAALPGFSLVDEKGRIPYEESIAEMRRSDIGLVCSQFGHGYDLALPNKLFEYMAVGLPVIASDFPLWRELLGSEDCVIFVDPSSPRMIAAAIDKLAKNENLRNKMGVNGQDAVRRRFSWQAESENLVNLYQEVLSCS